jgi:hypothetical protein
MRLFELFTLAEYKRDITVQKMGDKLAQVAASHENKELSPEKIVAQLEQADPTPNKKYMMWLIKQYQSRMFRLEDAPRIHDLLTTYVKAQPRLPAEQKDLNRLTLHQLDDLVDSWSETTPDADSEYSKITDLDVLYDGPYGVLSVPKTESASCEIGSGTKWCTAAKKKNMFKRYNKQGRLYVWIEKPGNKKYQFHFESGQFMDDKDREIDSEILRTWRSNHPVLSKLFAKKEPDMIKNPNVAINYAREVIKGRWPEAEEYIMQDPRMILKYAQDVIKGRWPEAESEIIKDPFWSVKYARDVIKGRWPEAEPTIVKHPYQSQQYARDVLGGDWPEAKEYIMKDPEEAFRYAKDTIEGRWPEAEPYILKNPSYAVSYAHSVIKGRWPEAEPIIMKHGRDAARYAQLVIKGRWPEAEKYIMQDPSGAKIYKSASEWW